MVKTGNSGREGVMSRISYDASEVTRSILSSLKRPNQGTRIHNTIFFSSGHELPNERQVGHHLIILMYGCTTQTKPALS